jgi:hypothetical protein
LSLWIKPVSLDFCHKFSHIYQRTLCTDVDLEFVLVRWTPDRQFHRCWKAVPSAFIVCSESHTTFYLKKLCIWVLSIVRSLKSSFAKFFIPWVGCMHVALCFIMCLF